MIGTLYMDMILHYSKRFLGVFLSAVTATVSISGCQQDNTNTSQQQTEPQQTAVAGTTAPTPVSTSVAPTTATTTTITPATSPAPSVPLPANTNTTSNTGLRYSLVSSSGQVVNANNLNQSSSISPGSSGAGSRPELEGANTLPLSDAELAAINTPSARIILEAIIGTDSRFKVNPYTYPERAVSLITYNGSTHCTGWLVSKDTLVTAGHCVYSLTSKWRDASAFRIYPGYSDNYTPYGSCGVKAIYSSYGWVMAADSTADIGLLKLDCSIGNSTGYFGYFAASSVDNTSVTINGYPGDKNDARQQWASIGTISRSTDSKLYYDNDTYGGMSGSPIWVRNSNNDTAWGIGIHTAGETTTNSGTRISQDVYELITAVKELP
jgi:glutamyl endopeptidase